MFSKELIEQARCADLLQYLQSKNYRLIRSSPHEYRLEEHDSLVISNNKWHWFSRDLGGNTLDFLVKYEEMRFTDAVKVLIYPEYTKSTVPMSHHKQSDPDIDPQPSKSFAPLILPPKNQDSARAFAYLNKTRKIDSGIITDMLKQGILYESVRHNIVFIGKDKEGNICFSSERGTSTTVSYKKDCPGSNKQFSFHMEGRSNTLYTFEAPLDALSHATLCKLHKLDYTEDHRLSLGCLGNSALNQYLEDRPEIKNIILCLDNDSWGRAASAKFMQQLKEKGYMTSEELPKYKDYNDDLVALIKSKTLEMIL